MYINTRGKCLFRGEELFCENLKNSFGGEIETKEDVFGNRDFTWKGNIEELDLKRDNLSADIFLSEEYEKLLKPVTDNLCDIKIKLEEMESRKSKEEEKKKELEHSKFPEIRLYKGVPYVETDEFIPNVKEMFKQNASEGIKDMPFVEINTKTNEFLYHGDNKIVEEIRKQGLFEHDIYYVWKKDRFMLAGTDNEDRMANTIIAMENIIFFEKYLNNRIFEEYRNKNGSIQLPDKGEEIILRFNNDFEERLKNHKETVTIESLQQNPSNIKEINR